MAKVWWRILHKKLFTCSKINVKETDQNILSYLKIFADEERQRDQEKWSNFLKDIDNNLKKDKFSTVLQLVDKYLADCKTPELHLQALMKKAQSCLGAWQQTSRWKSEEWIDFIICWPFSLSFDAWIKSEKQIWKMRVIFIVR